MLLAHSLTLLYENNLLQLISLSLFYSRFLWSDFAHFTWNIRRGPSITRMPVNKQVWIDYSRLWFSVFSGNRFNPKYASFALLDANFNPLDWNQHHTRRRDEIVWLQRSSRNWLFPVIFVRTNLMWLFVWACIFSHYRHTSRIRIKLTSFMHSTHDCTAVSWGGTV